MWGHLLGSRTRRISLKFLAGTVSLLLHISLGYGRIDAFELWCWRRPLRVPWTARRSNQSILKEMFIGGTDVEAETPILWPPDAES